MARRLAPLAARAPVLHSTRRRPLGTHACRADADIGYPDSAGEPPKQLKGFFKVTIAQGDHATISFTLSATDVQVWLSGQWTIVPGTYAVYIGSSSADIRLTGTVAVSA
jgi:hypothetical protein